LRSAVEAGDDVAIEALIARARAGRKRVVEGRA
jgi:hypothetical protein